MAGGASPASKDTTGPSAGPGLEFTRSNFPMRLARGWSPTFRMEQASCDLTVLLIGSRVLVSKSTLDAVE